MVSSEYCSKPMLRDKKSTKWRAGKDTVYNHFLFTRKNSVAFIKSYVAEHYHFKNPVDSIKFINPPCEEETVNPKNLLIPPSAGGSGGNDDPFGGSPAFWLTGIFACSLLTGGVLYWLVGQKKLFKFPAFTNETT
jgi:hypothetical protein